MTAPAGVPTTLVEDSFTGSLVEVEQGSAAPLYPPDEWVSQRAADESPTIPAGAPGGPMKLMVYPGGRVAGVVAPAGQCIIGGAGGDCWTIPRPADAGSGEVSLEHTRAHGGYMKLASGAVVPNGVIGGGKGHAPMFATNQNVQAFYADTSTQLVRGQYRWSDAAGGLCFVGALWPEITERQVAGLMASPASIDYRWIVEEGDYRLMGSCLVNIPGFPSRWKMAARRVASAMILEPVLADAGPSTGTMLALRIDAPGLAFPGGLAPEELHVTLGYFGDSAVYDDAVRNAVTQAVGEAVVIAGRPLLLEVNGPAVLGPPDEPVTVLLVQAEGMTELRDAALAAAEYAGLVLDESYPQWIPHITIGDLSAVPIESALGLVGVTIAPPSLIIGFGSDDWREVDLPKVGLPYGDLEVAPDVASSADGSVSGSVTAIKETVMANVCATCGGHQAAPPAPGAPPAPAPAGEPAGDADAATVKDLVSRVTALEATVAQMMSDMGSMQMASLIPPPMPAFA